MTVEQRSDFEERRLQLMRKHIDKNPLVRAYYRKRRRAIISAFLGSIVAFILVMLLLKSFLIAYEGPAGYGRMVAQVAVGQAPDGLVVRLLTPDPISAGLASMLVSILPARAPNPAPRAAPAEVQSAREISGPQAAGETAQSADMMPPANPQETPRPRAVLQLTE